MSNAELKKQTDRVNAIRAALPRKGAQGRGSAPLQDFRPAPMPPPPPVTLEVAPQTSTLYEYWRIVRKRIWAVLAAALVGMVAGYLLTFPQKRLYRASTRLEIQGLNENFMGTRDLDPTANTSPNYSDSYIETLVQLLQGDTLIDRVADRLNLTRRPEFQASQGTLGSLMKSLDPIPAQTPPAEQARKVAQSNLRIRSSRTNRIVEVEYVSNDPKLSADFANTLADEFIKQYVEVRWNSTERTADWLNKYMEGVKAKLSQSEMQLQQYARMADILFTTENDTVAASKLRQVQDELSRAEASRVSKQSEFNLVSTSPMDSLPAVLDNPMLKDYQLKLTDLRRQLAELLPTLKPAHYRIKQVQSQIAELERALEKERANIVKRIQNEYESARNRESLLKGSFEEQAKLVSDQAAKAVRYNMLKREVETNRQLYESTLQKVKDARIAASMRASNIRVVDPATPPSAPYRPNVMLNTLIGTGFGLVLGLAFAIGSARAGKARVMSERKIIGPGDSTNYLDVPELGVIPSAMDRAGRLRQLLTSGASDPSADGSQIELVTWAKSRSPIAESFRAIVASILFSGGGNVPRVIVVTSPEPGDGKTTTASNLAIALAEVSSNVLLIDGDMRKPRLHSVYAMESGSGLSDLLKSELEDGSSLIAEALRPTSVPGLQLITAGTGPLTSATVLYSARLTALLEQFRRQFDVVVIDAPPMLRLADARFLGRLADGVILVVRSGSTHQQAALAAQQRLIQDGTRILGTVLNDWDPRGDEVSGMADYGYYYSSATNGAGRELR